jgi:ribulose-5-phosphate 4-epimerase/fuculose-1-phosphate aldolase
MPAFPGPPKFDDPYKERAYLKGRLAAAFRIFGKYGFDEGVAGHITLRVCFPLFPLNTPSLLQ